LQRQEARADAVARGGPDILALAAPRGELVRKYPQTTIIEVTGKALSERTGEWTWRASLGSGIPSTAKFMLKP
jgi:hypothetical protein